MLRMKYQIGRSPERTIDEDLEGVVDLTDIRTFRQSSRGSSGSSSFAPTFASRTEKIVGAVLLRNPVKDEVNF